MIFSRHNSLMNSPGHKANILNPNVTVIGIGIETANNSVMVTQNFANTSASLQLDTGMVAKQIVAAGTVGTASADWLALTSGTVGNLSGLNGNDILEGSSGQNSLYDGNGNDELNGNGGNDDLYGGIGADALSGGAGTDQARYSTATARVTADLQ